MKCIKCRLRRLYYRLWRAILLPLINLSNAIRIEDRVIATLYKDGKILKRIVGPRIHNKWHEGMNSVVYALEDGCTASPGLKAEYMRLGSQCSDETFTFITGTEQGTTNVHVADYQVKFTATWPAAGAISNICQVLLRIRSYTGTGTVDAALYNFGTQFDKPDGVSLKIEWTTTLSSP